jgi:DNA-binding CsgD family transcriptional regulator
MGQMKATPAFQSLVERIEGFDPREDSPEEILEAIAETYGMSHVAYLGLHLPEEEGQNLPLFHVTYPKIWVEHYLEREYLRKDPVIPAALKSILPTDWADLPRDDKYVKRIFGEAKEFGIGSQGLSFPIRGRQGEKALFTIVGDIPERDWQTYKRSHMPDFNVLGFYIHAMVLKKLSTSPIEDVRLAPREISCLEWAANGKTFEDIGDIIGISAHTVRMYLDTARHKLNCLNITHAVARAIKMEIIPPPK